MAAPGVGHVVTRSRADAGSVLAGACDDVRDAGQDDAVDGVAPAVVARPASTAEVSSVLAAACAHGLAVVARGAGTKLAWGRPPERLDVVLDLTRLGRVLDHAAGDLVVEVEAGTPLARVQEVVASAGQRLLLEDAGPVAGPGATVGGTVATGASGPLRLRGGTARDLLIGATAVRADGVVASTGGRVVKNVAGYDVGKLLVGSYGTLAVLTRAVFRLHPLPEASRWVQVAVPDAAIAWAAVRAVLRSQVVPSAVELEWPVGRVQVLLEGTEHGVAQRVSAVRSLLGATGARAEGAGAAGPPPTWGRLPWQPGGTALKLTFSTSGLPEVLAAAAATPGLALRGSAGAGVLHGAPHGPVPVAEVAAAVTRLRAVCSRHGGACVVLDAPPEVKAGLDSWGPVGGLDLMRRLKEQFDPGRLLAPGRFVGGI